MRQGRGKGYRGVVWEGWMIGFILLVIYHDIDWGRLYLIFAKRFGWCNLINWVYSLIVVSETTRASPRLNTKIKRPLSRVEQGETSVKHDIVVVAEGSTQEHVDPELQKLENIPVFVPLMRTSLNIPALLEPEVLERLDTRQLVLLCHRYQEHLRQCAEAVAFDQNALCVRIKEVCLIFSISLIFSYRTHLCRQHCKDHHLFTMLWIFIVSDRLHHTHPLQPLVRETEKVC